MDRKDWGLEGDDGFHIKVQLTKPIPRPSETWLPESEIVPITFAFDVY